MQSSRRSSRNSIDRDETITSLYSNCKREKYLIVKVGTQQTCSKKAAQITDDSKFIDAGFVTVRLLSQDRQLEEAEFEYELKRKIRVDPIK
mmetsp:Transcript_1138/g.1433  ORF Transcript_1138/g.1433 Transcript_1138/m.1433 type:complete len:91 (+) Transcript_1138:202-474(+)